MNSQIRHSLGSATWDPPPPDVVEEFLAYSEDIDVDATLDQYHNVIGGCRKFLSTDEGAQQYFEEIDQKSTRGEAASYIRLGDADGNVLFPYLSKYPALAQYNLERISKIYFGNGDLMFKEVEFFREIVVSSCENASGIGAPGLKSVSGSFAGYGPHYDVRGKSGFRGVYNFFGGNHDANKLSGALWTSTWISRHLLPYYFRLLRGKPAVGFITCYEDLPLLLQQRCDIAKTIVHVIPMQASIARQIGRQRGLTTDIKHYPEVFEKICEEIDPPRPGTIYLVAAGILSKAYCTIIKQRGGIAIDIGSTADIWMGVRSRPELKDDIFEKWGLKNSLGSIGATRDV